MAQFKREISRERKRADHGFNVRADDTTAEIKKGGIQQTTKKRNSTTPYHGVKPLPKMGTDLQGQLNCDHRKFEPVGVPDRGKKIPINQRRNIENQRYDSKGSTM